MYHIIGGDGREYGPVTAEQLNEWIAAGRANHQTKIKREGDADWSLLSAFTEFADALAAKSASGPTPDPLLLSSTFTGDAGSMVGAKRTGDSEALAEEALARNRPIEIGSSLGRAWDLLKSDFWPIIGVSALVLILWSAVSILQGPLLGGLFAYYLRRIRGQPATLNDAFSGFSNGFLQLFLAGLISGLLIAAGLFLCVIPGVYLAVAWGLALPIVMDKQIGFWEGMEVSRKVMTANWWSMFLFLLVTVLINIGGALLCGVGTFLTLPWTLIASAYIYEDLFGPTKTAVP